MLFVAITLAVAIRPIVDWLRARGLPEGSGVLVVYACLLALLVGLVLLVGPLLVEQTNALLAQLPEYYQQLRIAMLTSGNRILQQIVVALPVVPQLPATAPTAEESPFAIFAPTWQLIRTTGYALFILGAIGVLAYYWTLEGELITRRLILLAPLNRRDDIRTLLAEMGGTIGNYFRGQAILCLMVGGLSLLGYWVVGLEYALSLALIMAVCEAIPMIGPTLGAIPAVLVAFSTSPSQVVWVLGVVVIIQVLENNLLVPRVMNKSVGVNPVISILSFTAFASLFGFGGAILAIPLAAMIQIVLNRLFFQLPSEDETTFVEQVAGSTERNAASKLRLQAQELVMDVRKSLRKEETAAEELMEPEFEEIEDSLEAIAVDLDALLSQAEVGNTGLNKVELGKTEQPA
jgi:predicted PurR-regulated permease PerM